MSTSSAICSNVMPSIRRAERIILSRRLWMCSSIASFAWELVYSTAYFRKSRCKLCNGFVPHLRPRGVVGNQCHDNDNENNTYDKTYDHHSLVIPVFVHHSIFVQKEWHTSLSAITALTPVFHFNLLPLPLPEEPQSRHTCRQRQNRQDPRR